MFLPLSLLSHFGFTNLCFPIFSYTLLTQSYPLTVMYLCVCNLICNVFLAQGSTWTLSGPSDDVTADDSASNAGGIIRDTAEDFPSLGLPQGLTEKQGYKVSVALKTGFDLSMIFPPPGGEIELSNSMAVA